MNHRLLFRQATRLALWISSAFGCSAALAVDVVLPADFSFVEHSGNYGIGTVDGILSTPWSTQPTYAYISTNTDFNIKATSLELAPDKVSVSGGETKSLAETTGSRLVTSAFTAVQGQTLSVNLNYLTTDAAKFSDYAWARVVNTQDSADFTFLFAARSTSQGSSVFPGAIELPGATKTIIDTNYFSAHGVEFNRNAPDVDGVSPVWAPLGGSSGTCFTASTHCGTTDWLKSTYTFASGGSYRLEFGVAGWGDQLYQSGLAIQFDGMTSPNPEPATYALMGISLALIGLNANRRRKRPSTE
jgi:PEP-CTERM motif